MSAQNLSITATLAQEIKAKETQVAAAIALMDEGNTVPFIARYRKEATQGLDDSQLRLLAERLHYLRELAERKIVVIESIREQGKLSPELEQAIQKAETRSRLEDLYLPHRPKRRTKATIAKEAGLEPLAEALLKNPSLDPLIAAKDYQKADTEFASAEAALEGAGQILMENFAENADLLEEFRQYLWQHAIVQSTGAKGQKAAGNKFSDYFDYKEALRKIPSHRALALFRGRREQILQLSILLSEDPDYGINRLASFYQIENKGRPADLFMQNILQQTWKIKLSSKLELELMAKLRELADEEAIKVFACNLRDLLLAAPAGPKVTLGLDPGIRTGVKAVVVDSTGKLLDYSTVFPFAPQNEWHQAIASLAKLVSKYQVELVSIGNGTASRETERLVMDLIKMYPDMKLSKVVVSEAGASVYSASELASNEFPDLDVSLRGAVSIARRLQDPLAELVKIEPKSIGVGQYQHDVNQSRLARSLEAVVEDCVNAVGVDVNTASVALLSRIAGFNENLAKNLVAYRDEHGAFMNREQLKNVVRLGDKAFEQSAGFLRIMQGDNPLDASAVHPEAYPLVEKILENKKVSIKQIIGNRELLHSLNAADFADQQFGLPTIRDVLLELEKPGRDPRPVFQTATFKEGVEDISHLEIGMILEGVVSNVTNFGAFVDIGVHQDGLVHISAMKDRFISDPRSVVKAGDIVKVKVVEVDKERRRINLSMKLQEEGHKLVKPESSERSAKAKFSNHSKGAKAKGAMQAASKKPADIKKSPGFNTAMADALSKLKAEL